MTLDVIVSLSVGLLLSFGYDILTFYTQILGYTLISASSLKFALYVY